MSIKDYANSLKNGYTSSEGNGTVREYANNLKLGAGTIRTPVSTPSAPVQTKPVDTSTFDAFASAIANTNKSVAERPSSAEDIDRVNRKNNAEINRMLHPGTSVPAEVLIESAQRRMMMYENDPTKSAEYEKAVADYNIGLQKADSPNLGKVAKIVGKNVWADAGVMTHGLADLTLGNLAKGLDYVAGTNTAEFFDKNFEWAKEQKAAVLKELEQEAKGNKGVEVGAQVATAIVEAIPALVLALMTGGASVATTGALNAASTAAGLSGASGFAYNALNIAKTMAKNPSYWGSFVQEVGNNYAGATEWAENDSTAATYALLTSFITAGAEIGLDGVSGIQGLAKEVASGNPSRFIAWLKSAIEEGNEEVVQSLINRGMQILFGNEDAKVENLEDVGNLAKELGGEWAMGTAVGGILGGATQSINNLVQKIGESSSVSPTPSPAAPVLAPETSVNATAEQNGTDGNTEALAGDVFRAVVADSVKQNNERRHLVEKIRDASVELSKDDAVANIRGNEVPKTGTMVERMMQYISSIGNKVSRPNFGDVLFSRSKIKASAIGHGASDAKIEAFAAVPSVIEKGKQIDFQKNWNGKNYDSYIFAAPVLLRGKKTYIGVVVHQDKLSNRYYVHEVIDENGELIYKNKEVPPLSADGTSALAGDLDTVKSDGTNSFDDIISEEQPIVNGDGLGAMNPRYAYVEKQNQQNSTQSALAEEERAIEGLRPEDATHKVTTEAESVYKAKLRVDFDFDGEVNDLASRDYWGAEDVDVAHLIHEKFISEARQTGDYSKVIEWNKILTAHTSAQGSALQANAKYARAPEKVIGDAAETLSEAGLSGTELASVMDEVSQFAYEYDNAAKAGDINALADIVRRISAIRRTGSFFNNKLSKQMNWAINRIIENGDVEYMKELAANSVTAMSNDYIKPSLADRVKSWRVNSMLSKISTTMRNLASNNVFDPLDTLSRDASVPLDILLSKFTGTRSVAVDKSWFSKAKRKGTVDGLAKALVAVGLDIDAGIEGKYETGGSRTHKMSGGVVSRLMSTWEKFTGYAMRVTDAAQKGGIEAEIRRGLEELYASGSLADEDFASEGALQEALYRTFQDETALSKLSLGARDALNNVRIAGMGIGDFVLPFAKTPANLASRSLEYSPAGLAKGVYDMVSVLIDAKHGKIDAAAQAKAVQEIGRGINGSSMIAIATALALNGVLKVSDTGRDEEDKDKSAIEKQSGLSGAQLNLSAIKRWVSGESTDWQDGDVLMDISFLEPMNAFLTTGALIAEDIEAEGLSAGGVVKNTLSGTLQSVMSMPVMETFASFGSGYEYSDGETEGERLVDAALSYGASQVSSFIPNIIKGAAQGTDKMQRDVYGGDTLAQEVANTVKSSIPWARQTISPKVDSYGKEMEVKEDWLTNFLNNNILPGKVTKYSENPVTAYLNDVYDETGATSIYPNRNAPSSVTSDGTKYELTSDEKGTYKEVYGTKFFELAKEASEEGYTAEESAEILGHIKTIAAETAMQKVMEDKGIKYETSSLTRNATASGDVTDFLADYIMYPEIMNGTSWGKTQRMLDAGLTLEQYSAMDKYFDELDAELKKKNKRHTYADVDRYCRKNFGSNWYKVAKAYKG